MKSTVERVCEDDPDTPEIDNEFWCRSTSAPWILEKVGGRLAKGDTVVPHCH